MMVLADAVTVIPVIVGAATALAGVVTWFVNGVRAERTRLQTLYADAYSAVVSYQEFPYMIRRRRAPGPDGQVGNEERLRISSELHAVQEALNNHLAQISMESAAVSEKYTTLVHRTREVAGSYMREAWQAPALDNDAGMNIAGIDYTALESPQDDYLDAVKSDMTFWRVALPRRRKPRA